MRVVAIWRDNTDYARSVIEFLRDIEHRIGKAPESYSPDSPEGESLARSYDIVEYPSILAINDDGQLVQLWRGTMLPKIDDVSFYLLENH
jgi:hypothetical protein